STPPVISCPGNVTIECTASTLAANTGSATATDNCSVPVITSSDVIAANMELINALSKFVDDSDNGKAVRQEALEAIVLMLSPIVPHICHQLWLDLGHQEAVVGASWPEVDAAALEQDTLELVLQVNGKLRSKMSVSVNASKEEIEAMALSDEHIKRFIEDQPIKKVIVVPKKLVNIVV
ncbi:MAG: class I tRNA ligase family protein, partial [Methylobacter sp.]